MLKYKLSELIIVWKKTVIFFELIKFIDNLTFVRWSLTIIRQYVNQVTRVCLLFIWEKLNCSFYFLYLQIKQTLKVQIEKSNSRAWPIILRFLEFSSNQVLYSASILLLTVIDKYWKRCICILVYLADSQSWSNFGNVSWIVIFLLSSIF